MNPVGVHGLNRLRLVVDETQLVLFGLNHLKHVRHIVYRIQFKVQVLVWFEIW